MATKGRLTMSGRREYYVVPIRNITRERMIQVIGYAAVCACSLGNHYLAPDGEHTAQPGVEPYTYPTASDAQAAIEAWQRQHDERRWESAESEA